MPSSGDDSSFASPDATAAGEGHVFRDFETSRILAIRRAVRHHPWRYTSYFVGAALLWTVVMSAGAALQGDGSLAVNLTPHVAHFVIVLGVFFYPPRLLWVPLATYLVVFLYAFYQPFQIGLPWSDLPGMTAGWMAVLFGMNLLSGAVIGTACFAALLALRHRLNPHSLDLAIAAVAFASIVLVTALHYGAMLRLAAALPAEFRPFWGFSDNYHLAALRRIGRSGVVLSVFLLLAVEYPRRAQFRRTALTAALFPALALLQHYGAVLHPMIDVILLGIVVTLVTPVRVSIAAVTAGIAIYAAMTGNFLDDRVLGDRHEAVLVNYSNLGLVALNLIFALRSHAAQVLAEKDAAIHKLGRARDFAGVGLFAANRATRRFRLDAASARMLRLPAEGRLEDFLRVFGDGAPLVGALAARTGRSTTLTLPADCAGQRRMLRLWVWAETTPTGAAAAYGLIIDITESEDREARLRDALETLSLREERQRQLFSIISHELRTPASVLSLLIDDLDDSGNAPRNAQLREARDQLMTVLDDMRQTVNPEQNLPIRRVAYVPAQLAETVRNAMDLTAQQSGMSIDLSLGAGARQARTGDVVRVRQALINLVRNAILHSRGTTVRIVFSALPAGDDGTPVTEWRIEDDGIGIDPAEVDRLFEPFVRGGKEADRRADGSGLGMFIARGAIGTLGGTLDHYRPARGGTGFVIRLPEPLCADTRTPAETASAPALPDRDWTVVLAEDNALVAEITKARLERLRASVRIATDGREALRMVAEEQPDVVITDLFMPELDGDDLARRLRRGGYDRPILGLTAAVVGEEMDRFHRAGVNAVMKKPLDFERLSGFLRDGFPSVGPDAVQDASD